MSKDSIKTSIIKLRELLSEPDAIDQESLELAKNLETDLQRILDSQPAETAVDDSLDLAMAMEARFESEHPVLAGVTREIINALHRMGV